MNSKEEQEEFKQILLYGYQRGNDDHKLSAVTLVKELSEMMKDMIEKDEDQNNADKGSMMNLAELNE
ncbi:hypothetical protein ACIQ4I_13920 [Rummeliibacillus sp. NPDC094406]|uniref:hypothetical protein n=1 Tax=Rummeliibacillus sp. NPDC094406 TaxID=3364511 RepID=UPI0037F44324